MRTLIGSIVLSASLAVAGPAFACGDVADAHDDALAALTKPVQNATPVAKPATDAKQVVPLRAADKRGVAAAGKPSAVKVAARTSGD